VREAALEQIASGASAAFPKGAPKAVSAMLAQVAKSTSVSAENDDSDDIVAAAIAAAEDFADQIMKGAVKGIKKAPTGDRPGLMNDIAKEAFNTLFDSSVDAGYLADEVARQAGVTAKGLSGDYTTVASLVSSIFTTGSNIPVDAKTVGLIAAGLMSGTQQESLVASQINGLGNAYAGFTGYVNEVLSGFATAKGAGADSVVAAGAVVAATNAGNVNFAPARVAGASAWLSGVAVEIIAGMLDKDSNLGGTASVAEIVEAAVRGNQKKAPSVAANATAGGTAGTPEPNRLGQILQGTALGLDGHPLYNVLLRGSAIKTVKASGATGLQISEITQFGITGAISSGNLGGIADVAFGATKAGKNGTATVAGVVAGATGADSDEQWRGLLGAMAADKKNAAAIRTAAFGLGGWDGASNGDAMTSGPAVQGGDAIIDMHTNKKNFFNFSLKALRDADTDTDVEALAILTAAGLIDAKNTQAVAAALLAETPVSVNDIRAQALALNPKAAAGVNLAIDAANGIKNNPNNIFEIVDHLTQQNPKQGVDIATGAAAIRPDQAHIVMHASAFRNPGKAGKATTAIFGVMLRDADATPGDDDIDNTVAAAAAVAAAGTCGILAAQSPKQEALLKSFVASATKAALLLTGNGSEGAGNFQQSDNGGSPTLTTQKGPAGVTTGAISQLVNTGATSLSPTALAVITAIAKTAKAYGLEIAQAAGQAARAIAGASFTGAAAIGAAVAAGAGGSAANYTNAANFGIAQAASSIVGAGAAGVVNYAHFNATGAPVTSIFDL
jgi:hypothetical protein